MRDQIINNLDNPGQLERMFRDNRTMFRNEFNIIYGDISSHKAAQVWNERLNYEGDEISWGTGRELTIVLVLAFIAGLIAKLPDFINMNEEFFYPRNMAFIFLPGMMVYFAWKHQLEIKRVMITMFMVAAAILYMNLLPGGDESDTLVLACIHMPLFMWALLGTTFVGNRLADKQGRIDFLKYNGDLLVMSAIIVIAGGILTAVTLGLFELIGIKIEEFYFQNIVKWGLAGVPVVATFLVSTNPQLVSRVSPVIAKIFTPLVLITLVVYLVAMLVTGKNPYTDREFLIIFNLLLVGVMALILFSVAESSGKTVNNFTAYMLLALSVITIVVNGIALSAILFRISEWGMTPNRLAVLGGNVLILTNLLIVTLRLFKGLNNRSEIEKVQNSISSYLPVYAIWTLVVILLFPVIFSFK